MDDNKKFWQRTAFLYEKFTRGGKSAARAYDELEASIVEFLNKNMKVLELAAGPGMLSGKLAKASKSLEVTDFSEEMIEMGKRKQLGENVTFAVADATALKYGDKTFDAVVISNALHIMPDPSKALKEIRRVLKEDGILIAPTFTRENMKSRLVEKLMEAVGFVTYSRWTHSTYQEFLKSHGFEIRSAKVIEGHNFPISFVVCSKRIVWNEM